MLVARIITERVRVGLSACLFGCPVRYNGKALDALALLGREKADFAWTPVCPECLAGLGVPRDPIHLTGSGQMVLRGEAAVRDRRGHDVTQRVVEASRAAMDCLDRAGIEVFIAKEASPTCGLRKARVGKRRTESAEGSGVFGALLLERDWFLVPDSALANPLLWWDWRRRMHAWLWLRRQPVTTSRELYDAWHVVKFIAQETDRPGADAIGRALAELPKSPSPARLNDMRTVMLESLKRPSTRSRIKGALQKAYAHARKAGQLDGVQRYGLADAPEHLMHDIESMVRDLTAMERISFDNDLLFGASPVLRRDRRRLRPDGEGR